MLPAAIVGVAPTRRARLLVVLAGLRTGGADAPYVTSAFTTFLVFLLLLDGRPEDAGSRFSERLLETLLGVSVAYLFGLALPAVARRSATAAALKS
jgi:hypothetical protein